MQAYCFKCKCKKNMKDAQLVTLKNGRNAKRGTCPTCGHKLFKMS